MRYARLLGIVLCAAWLGLGAGRALRVSTPNASGLAEPHPSRGNVLATSADMQAERARIASHLTYVEKILRATDVRSLPPAKRAARAAHLAVLHAYRERGLFPHNHRGTARQPVFVDPHGTRCALGELIARSGGETLTRRIAATRNTARVRELANDPELGAWLDAAGLTLAEAALIQPEYGPFVGGGTDEESDAYALTTLGATAVNAGLIGWNVSSGGKNGSRWPGALGLTAGLAQVGIGIGGFAYDQDGREQIEYDVTNFVVGTASVVLGVLALRRTAEAPPSPAIAARSGDASKPDLRWSLAAWMPREVDAGLRVAMRF